MAQWKVTIEKVSLFPHPNADSLQLAKVGQHQLVVRLNSLKQGEEVVFIPQRSLLPDAIAEPFRTHLKGKEKNRVGAVRLRGELSMGIVLSVEEATQHASGDLPRGQCVAALLGVEKYEPPIPVSLSGEVEPASIELSKHDVEQFGIYADQFEAAEEIIVTEKVHGSQVMYFLTGDGDFGLSSKGLGAKGLLIRQSTTNTYWAAAANCHIRQRMQEFFTAQCSPVDTLQFFGEAVPVQGGRWSYSFQQPHVLLFDVRINGESVAYDRLESLRDLWIPVVYRGKYSEADFPRLCTGNECVSGKELHIREGVVVRPNVDRRASDGTRLMVKVINPKYAKKETGDELS